MIIEQQDFLQEYLKDKPDFRYEVYSNWFSGSSDFILIQVYDEYDNYYCKIKTLELGNLPLLAFFILPQTYEQFKTIMDIFLGVENANP